MCYSGKVGQKIKELREQKGLTVEQLAEKCSLDADVINSIESSENAPNVAVLAQIAKGMNMRADTFIDEGEGNGPVLTRNGEGVETTNYSNGHAKNLNHASYCSLAAAKPGSRMEPYIIELKNNSDEKCEGSRHEGEELVYVLEGEVNIAYGNKNYILKQGDSLYFDSIISHSINTPSTAKVLAVVYTPIN